jgi:hypothetical protein
VDRLLSSRLPDALDELQTLVAQNPLHAADGISLAVEQMMNAAQKIDIVRAVITAAARAFHRLDLVEAGFPEAQHMLRHLEILGYLADRAKCIGRLVHVVPRSG